MLWVSQNYIDQLHNLLLLKGHCGFNEQILIGLDTYLLYLRCCKPLNKINHNSLKIPL